MPKRSNVSISGRTVEELSVKGKDTIFWDRALPGFGVRVYPSGRKIYVVQSRARGTPKRITLGAHGHLTAERARKRAAHAIDRIKRGEEPVNAPSPAEATLADLAERYMSAHVAVNCNAHTAGIYRGSLDNHILPTLGALPLGSVERSHVAALHYRLRDTPRAANRALMVLSKMFTLAAAWGLVAEGHNPCRTVRKYRENKRERFLTRDEYRRLGAALAEAEAAVSVWPYAIAALRLLMLTGCRLNEILTLRWDDVDRTAGEFRLRDSKTGARMVPLTPTAEAVLAEIIRVPDNPWINVGKKPGTRLTSINCGLVSIAGASWSGRCAHPRSPAQLRQQGACGRGEPVDDRQAARPRRHPEYCALRSSGRETRSGSRRPEWATASAPTLWRSTEMPLKRVRICVGPSCRADRRHDGAYGREATCRARGAHIPILIDTNSAKVVFM